MVHTCTWYLELQRDLYLLPSPQVTAALDTGTSFIAWFQVYAKTVTGWYGWSMSGIVLSKLQRDYDSPLEESLFIKQYICIYIHSVMQPHQCSSLKWFRGSFVTGLDQSVLLVDDSFATLRLAWCSEIIPPDDFQQVAKAMFGPRNSALHFDESFFS